jgi:hypothetical protein
MTQDEIRMTKRRRITPGIVHPRFLTVPVRGAFVSSFVIRMSSLIRGFGFGHSNFGTVFHLLVTLALCGAAGCQTAPPPKPQVVVHDPAPLPTDKAPTADQAVGSDACSNQLHDIEGALVLYYATNKRMPDSLEEIKPFGTDLQLACPVSHLPYGYSQSGLMAPGTERRIYVWDPTPAHHGIRWCIVMARPEPGMPLVAEVSPLGEKEFAAFLPGIQ